MNSYQDRLLARWLKIHRAQEHSALCYGRAVLDGCQHTTYAENHAERYHRLDALRLRLDERIRNADNRPATQPTLVEALHALGDAHDAVIARRNRT